MDVSRLVARSHATFGMELGKPDKLFDFIEIPSLGATHQMTTRKLTILDHPVDGADGYVEKVGYLRNVK